MVAYARNTGPRYEQALAVLSPYAPPSWEQQIRRGMELSKKPYSPPVGAERDWDSKNFIVDRDEGSLAGGLGELAVMMSGKYDQREIYIFLDKHNQSDLGLDFEYVHNTHQVKSGLRVWSGGGLEVQQRHLSTTADYIHLIGKDILWYSGRREDWLVLEDERRRYYASVGEELPNTFTIERTAMERGGISILPIFDWARR